MDDAVHFRASPAEGPLGAGAQPMRPALAAITVSPRPPPRSPCTPAKPSSAALGHSWPLRPGSFPASTRHWRRSWRWPGPWSELPSVLRQFPGRSRHCPSACRSQGRGVRAAWSPSRVGLQSRTVQSGLEKKREKLGGWGPGIKRGGVGGWGRGRCGPDRAGRVSATWRLWAGKGADGLWLALGSGSVCTVCFPALRVTPTPSFPVRGPREEDCRVCAQS